MKKKFLKLSLYFIGILIILVVLLFLSSEYTSRPSFCSTCHYMEPYVEGWKTSTHSNVTCTDCHFPPGFRSKLHGKFTAISMVVNYMTGIYKKSKPWAEITDASCLRAGCHQERLLKGRVFFKEGIIFDHTPHLTKLRREKKLRCTSCHSQIVQGDHITVTESTCFLCHFKDQLGDTPIDDCTWCHSAPIKSLDIVEVKYDHSFVLTKEIDCKKCHGRMQVGDGAVPIDRCSTCHAEIGKIEKYQYTPYIHKKHVTDHKIECQNCHLIIQHKSVSKTADILPECHSCHDNSHQAQLYLFSGTGGKHIKSHPNPMFEGGLNCQACHVFHQYNGNNKTLGETSLANSESCEICHGKGYSKILSQWQKLMMEKMDFLDNSIVTVKSELESSTISGMSRKHAFSLVDEAEYNFQLVKNGNIVHNIAYSDELLLSSYKNLKRALSTIKSANTLPDFTLYSKLVPSECKNCHYGQEEIDVKAFGLTFSHNIHVMKNHLTCSNCHSHMNRHGELVMKRDDCLSCHHTPTEENCSQCHTVQTRMYRGTISFAEEELPDVMYEEDVNCRSCHEQQKKIIAKATRETCSRCHEEEYEETLMEWQNETKQSIDNISRLILTINYDDLSAVYRMKIDSINSNLELIRKDGSLGAHNIELVSETLNKFDRILREIPKEN